MKKFVSILLALIVLSVCVSSAMAEIELTYWHNYGDPEEKVFLEQVVPKFEEQNPGIKINAIRMPYEGLKQQVFTAIAGGTAPDLVRLDGTWVAQFAEMGALVCVDEMDGFQQILDEAAIGLMKPNLYKGKYYGVTIDANTTTGIFNLERLKELGMDEPPATLEELLAFADKVSPEEEKWLIGVQSSEPWSMMPFIWTLGGCITDDDYTVASGYLNGEGTVKAFETMKEWFDKGVISSSVLGEEPNIWGGIEAGNYAMVLNGAWFYGAREDSSNLPSATIPAVEERSLSVAGGGNLVILSSSQNADAAWKFMRFMMTVEAQMPAVTVGVMPTLTAAIDQIDTSEQPWMNAFYQQLKTARPAFVPSAQWPGIEEVLRYTFESIFRGTVGVQEGLDAAATQIDALLAK